MGGLITIAQFIVISPLVGMALGWILMIAVLWTFKNATPRRVDTLFRRLQLVSAAAFSLGHGGNDAQKTMGIITIALFSTGHLSGAFEVPMWVVLASHLTIGLGTMFGGWRIVKTMGMKLTKLQPVGGFCAETAGAVTLFGATLTGIPVSTTHTITGSIIGVGSTRRLSAVKWGIAGRILWAWVLTMPMAALVAALCAYALQLAGRS
jgi:PiT family inorganic phosphate transporter